MSTERETEDLAAARSRIDTELRAELAMAMGGAGNLLRHYRTVSSMKGGHQPFLLEQDLKTTLQDLLDARDGSLWRALENVLQHSECPEVQAWRLLAMSQYAAEHAFDIAEMQCQGDF